MGVSVLKTYLWGCIEGEAGQLETTAVRMDIGIDDILEATGGAVSGPVPVRPATGVSIDSRSEVEGKVFVAIKGPNFDGHDFVGDVLAGGAVAAVVQDPGAGVKHPDRCIITVKDTLEALGDIASFVRGAHNIPVVAVSGSAGKTTTKEMIASILSVSRKVLKTEGNRNNLVGLPLTLLNLDDSHRAAVVELGISLPWEMEKLVRICSPDVAVLTNIGMSHLETLGTVEGVAEAKKALFTHLGQGATRVVNLDDPLVVMIATTGGASLDGTVTYSWREDADVRVMEVRVEGGLKGTSATYSVRGEKVTVRFTTPGETNVVNGAAAAAAALALGATAEEIAEGLARYTPAGGRMEVSRSDGLLLLDDTYNANPESMFCALKTLAEAGARKVAILGDMLELGESSGPAHTEAGRSAAIVGVDVLVAIGEFAEDVAAGAVSAGVEACAVHTFADKAGALGALGEIIQEGDSVLVKGSRATGLEEIVEWLKGRGQFHKVCS